MMMRSWMRVAGVVAIVLAGQSADAQPPRAAIFTRPEPPSREVLQRLNLQLGWVAYIPTDGQRDGLYSVDVLDPENLIVQTRSGVTVLLDAETGEVRWRSRVGLPYRVAGHPVVNATDVFVINDNFLYALDRATGAVRWDFRLPGGVTAPPVVDNDFIYFATADGRLHSYALPPPDAAAPAAPAAPGAAPSRPSPLYAQNKKTTGAIGHLTSVREAGGEVATGPQPVKFWEYATLVKVEVPPLLTPVVVFVVDADGLAVGLPRVPNPGQGVRPVFQFQADGPVSVRPGQFQDVAYLASGDGNLHALSLRTGRVLWRHTGGQAAERTPAVLPDDVYIANRANGLARLDRATGTSLWRVPHGNQIIDRNLQADRFLAANPKFVYAADRISRLLVLDRRLGHQLSAWDTREFVFPVRNDVTDRLYLAANNGLIVCLHDREYPQPLFYRRLEEDLAGLTRQLLAQPVSNPGGDMAPLSEVLQGFRTRYRLKIEIDDRAFKEANLPPIGPIPVRFPKVDNRALGDVLQLILDQVGATYRIVQDTIRIVPVPPRPKGG